MESPDERVLTAYHEAGHAVVALAQGRPLHRVSIEPNTLRLGQCEIRKGRFRPSDDPLETEMLILLGGIAAESKHRGGYVWDGAGQDLRMVRHLASTRAPNERQCEKLLRRMLDKTEHLLDQPGAWDAVERIAAELVKETTISGRAARHHFEQAMAKVRG